MILTAPVTNSGQTFAVIGNWIADAYYSPSFPVGPRSYDTQVENLRDDNEEKSKSSEIPL